MQLFAVLAALLDQLKRDLNFEKTHTRPNMSAKHVIVKSVCGTGPISRGIDWNVYQKRGFTPHGELKGGPRSETLSAPFFSFRSN